VPAAYPAPNPEFSSGLTKSVSKNSQTQPQPQPQPQSQPQAQATPQVSQPPNSSNKASHDAKELHMFVWSSSASPVSEAGGLHFSGADFGASDQSGRSDQGAKEIRMLVADEHPQNGEANKGSTTRFFLFLFFFLSST